jgi:hypothetical protein
VRQIKTVELIAVFIDYRNGKTVCICPANKKRCGKNCVRDIVERDKYRDWEKTMNRSRFGKEY